MKDGNILGLFDLASDPREEKNLASAYPEKVKQMIDLQARWKKQCEMQQTSVTDAGKR
jgi:hypothetical protein